MEFGIYSYRNRQLLMIQGQRGMSKGLQQKAKTTPKLRETFKL